MKKYVFGDTAVYYAEAPASGGKSLVGFAMYPAAFEPDLSALTFYSLVQVAFTGDRPFGNYTRGVTMSNMQSTLLSIESQEADGRGVVTVLSDGAGNRYTHTLEYCNETGVFRVSTAYENATGAPRTLEMLSTFAMSGIAAARAGKPSTCGLVLYRMTSAWSRECRLKRDEFCALGLDESWGRYGPKVEKFGEVGSMSNRGYFPFAAIADEQNGVVWGALAEAPFSWQMEVFQETETCMLSGGLGDYETSHWRKTIPSGGIFRTHSAFFTVKKSLDAVCNAFVKEQDRRLSPPHGEDDMPVVYNEYCDTWGNPTEATCAEQIERVSRLPVKYFVIDAGWYRRDDAPWGDSMGDWNVNRALFPEGLGRVVGLARCKGLGAGIWYEFENAAEASETYRRESMLLRRDGAVIGSANRRFLDLRCAEAKAFLEEKFLRPLKENGFTYLKIDYNETYGAGCDGAESLGEGGRQVAEESIAWLDRLRAEMPDLVIENCASGGSRIEPLRMSKVSMCSFSDAHECAEIPLVAANVSRIIPARQSQIWAVLREGESDSRTIYSLCAAMFGRICLSGTIRPEKEALVREALAFYEAAKPVVRHGDIVRIDCTVKYYREPKGRQLYVKEYGGKRLVLAHFLDCEEEAVLPLEGYELTRAFTDLETETDGGALRIRGKAFRAGAFLLEKRRKVRGGD